MAGSSSPVALVTGAGSGIGFEAASMLAREGFRVVLVGRDGSKLTKAADAIAGADSSTSRSSATHTIAADLAQPEACQSVIDQTASHFGRLDVLVNNAGWTRLARIPQMDFATARRLFEINALAPVYCTLAACRQFGTQPPIDGRAGEPFTPCIVSVSSKSSVDPFSGLGVYGAAKASVNLLAKATAGECSLLGVRAFAVAPGAVETPLLRSMFPPSALPAERCLKPADVARVILDCVLGAYDSKNGQTIFVHSP